MTTNIPIYLSSVKTEHTSGHRSSIFNFLHLNGFLCVFLPPFFDFFANFVPNFPEKQNFPPLQFALLIGFFNVGNESKNKQGMKVKVIGHILNLIQWIWRNMFNSEGFHLNYSIFSPLDHKLLLVLTVLGSVHPSNHRSSFITFSDSSNN